MRLIGERDGVLERDLEVRHDLVHPVQIAPPHLDDLPAELAQATLSAEVIVAIDGRIVVLDALTLDAHLQLDVGEVEPRDQRLIGGAASAGSRRAIQDVVRWK